MTFALSSTDALIVIDLQNDFCPDGALEVQRGDEIVPLVNRLQQRFAHVALTQDWHPAGHISFATSHPGTHPFETIQVAYGPQVLWPDHCLQGSEGAAFHPLLDTTRAEMIVRKGYNPRIDSYSAFLDNDHSTPTGLAGALKERGIQRLFFCGLAYDYCVHFSAMDAVTLGFTACIIEDACRAIDLNGSVARVNAEMQQAGIIRLYSDMLL
ncbi:bifunctional nicotinamidase/pyrazinamidase [Terriglobus albidus]|uniref:bifunctional nicotinamidase/pyrazinamidase n=1 Tax=Terriglobus albidus TaxID=1592106 RepID=UPI0021DF5AB5|nr:bifunctional nicotinamidase/pyrazinamidase [Terriglobus albidus]